MYWAVEDQQGVDNLTGITRLPDGAEEVSANVLAPRARRPVNRGNCIHLLLFGSIRDLDRELDLGYEAS